MKKDALLEAVNTGSPKQRGTLWYSVGRYVYVPFAIILCAVALFMKVAFLPKKTDPARRKRSGGRVFCI